MMNIKMYWNLTSVIKEIFFEGKKSFKSVKYDFMTGCNGVYISKTTFERMAYEHEDLNIEKLDI